MSERLLNLSISTRCQVTLADGLMAPLSAKN